MPLNLTFPCEDKIHHLKCTILIFYNINELVFSIFSNEKFKFQYLLMTTIIVYFHLVF